MVVVVVVVLEGGGEDGVVLVRARGELWSWWRGRCGVGGVGGEYGAD